MSTVLSRSSRLEIGIAAVAVIAYLVVLPASLTAFCSTQEAHKPIAYSFTINGEANENGAAKDQKDSVASAMIGEIKASGSATQQQQAIDEPESWGHKFWCDINASDWFIGLFTLFLAIATYFLWRETERLAGGADDQADKMERSIAEAAKAAVAMGQVATAATLSAGSAAESVAALKERTAAQMRAYLTVLVHSALYQERRKDSSVLHFEGKPILINAGHTPARKVSYWANAGILPVPLPATYVLPEPPDKKIHSVVLGPHQSFVLNAIVPEVVDVSEVAGIKNGIGRSLYVWGRVNYEDLFGTPHVTEFCHSIFWQPGKDGEIIGGYYAEGRNDAD